MTTFTRKEARQCLQNIIANDLPLGDESLDILIQALTEKLAILGQTNDNDHGTSDDANDQYRTTKAPKIKRILFWSHHLLATSKRKDIVSWSRELHLSGFSRPGYPGAIVIEGSTDDADEFATRIKALRWQALQVRGEEQSNERLFVVKGKAAPFKEVEDLGGIVGSLDGYRDGLGKWFLEGMRIGHG